MGQPSSPVAPTLTSKNLPKPPAAPLSDAAKAQQAAAAQQQVVARPLPIVAKPLGMPQFDQVVSKNPNLSFRWVLRTLRGDSGHENLRYDQMCAAGFRPATPLDCVVKSLVPRENHWLNGDLILMCIPRVDYEGALLWNQQQAERKANLFRERVVPTVIGPDSGNGVMYTGEKPVVQAPPSMRTKIAAFSPSPAEAEGLNSSDDEKLKAILEKSKA